MDVNWSNPSPAFSTIVDLLRFRADKQPDQRSYTFLVDGEEEQENINYGELDSSARMIAAFLQSQGATGQRVLLLYPPGLDYIKAFLGCLYAGATAVPVYPPRLTRLSDRSFPRLLAIAHDARPAFVLTTSPILALAEGSRSLISDFPQVEWKATDAFDRNLAEAWQDPKVNEDTLAFLQYTSGSTSSPKGVMVSHRNLVQNQILIQHAFGLNHDSIVVCWLPLYHDMGLIGNVLQPLYTGFPCIMMSPIDFLQKPLRWLGAISRYQATVSGGPNFAYELCMSRITAEQRASLDLSSWGLAYTAAEPIREETIERFSKAFEPCGFRKDSFFPGYGLAEATLFVTGGPKRSLPKYYSVERSALKRGQIKIASEGTHSATLVGCGQLYPQQNTIIVDPTSRRRCLPNQIGEIWISGPNVTHGYWEKPEASSETFQAYLSDTGEGPFLRTGDLGFIQNGELIVTSRLKDLIIIRGQNHAPQDIEQTVGKCHSALRAGCGIAFSVNSECNALPEIGEQLIIVHEVDRHSLSVDVEAVARSIRQAVAETHGLHVAAVVLIKPGTIPKTSSGKLQRYVCREDFMAGTLKQIGISIKPEANSLDLDSSNQRSVMEILSTSPTRREKLLSEYLRHQVAGILQIPEFPLEPDQPITMLGIDSLKVLELKNQIENDWGIEIPLASFVEEPTLERLSIILLPQIENKGSRQPGVLIDGQLVLDPASLLEHLEQLSNEQVDSLLKQLEEVEK